MADGTILEGTAITMAPGLPEAGAIGIRGGLIEAVGTPEDVRERMGEGVERVDLGGAAIVPGFIDAHHHYSLAAFDAWSPDLHLPPGSGIADILALVEQARAARPGTGWLRLQGYDPRKLREGRAPRIEELDEVCPDRPLLVIAFSFHEASMNSRAFAEMGWDRGSPDPPHGVLVRDRRGRLTGEVAENALYMAEARSRDSLMENAGDAWIAESEAHGRKLLAAGIVRVGDAAVAPVFDPLYERAAAAGQLPLTVHRMPIAAAGFLDPRLDGEPTGSGSAAAPVGPAKLFMDGGERCALCVSMTKVAGLAAGTLRRAVTGASLAPIRASARLTWRRGRRGMLHTGMLFWDERTLDAAVREAGQRGLQVAQHAIGNEAIELAVGALERAGGPLADLPGRPRLEHAMFADATIARRIAAVGAVAVVQPYFVYDFLADAASLTPPPDPIRSKPLRTLLDAGVTLAGSSDYPIAGYDVLGAIRAAVTRRGNSGTVYEPDEALTVEETLRAYTMGGAEALGVASEAGSLELGKRADITVLSDDPRGVRPDELTDLRILRTYVGGQLVHELAEAPAAATLS